MTGTCYRLQRGVRLRRSDCGAAMLLIPEGIVELNDTAAAALELIDGSRDLDAVAIELAHRFDADPADVRSDVRDLLDTFVERGFLTR